MLAKCKMSLICSCMNGTRDPLVIPPRELTLEQTYARVLDSHTYVTRRFEEDEVLSTERNLAKTDKESPTKYKTSQQAFQAGWAILDQIAAHILGYKNWNTQNPVKAKEKFFLELYKICFGVTIDIGQNCYFEGRFPTEQHRLLVDFTNIAKELCLNDCFWICAKQRVTYESAIFFLGVALIHKDKEILVKTNEKEEGSDIYVVDETKFINLLKDIRLRLRDAGKLWEYLKNVRIVEISQNTYDVRTPRKLGGKIHTAVLTIEGARLYLQNFIPELEDLLECKKAVDQIKNKPTNEYDYSESRQKNIPFRAAKDAIKNKLKNCYLIGDPDGQILKRAVEIFIHLHTDINLNDRKYLRELVIELSEEIEGESNIETGNSPLLMTAQTPQAKQIVHPHSEAAKGESEDGTIVELSSYRGAPHTTPLPLTRNKFEGWFA